MTATTRYISTIDQAVATIESRRNRSDSGTLMSSVDRLLPRGSTNRPTAPAAMYPAVPKCPIASESSPEMRREPGWARAGGDKVGVSRRCAPKSHKIGHDTPDGAHKQVNRLSMHRQ